MLKKISIFILIICIFVFLLILYKKIQHKCVFTNNILAQKKATKVSIIKNIDELKLIQKLNIVDKEQANIGSYIFRGDNFYYILNKDDIWQYTFKKLHNKNKKTLNNFFTQDAIAYRKALQMHLINTQQEANYIKNNCTNIYNHKQAQIGSLISNANPHYSNLIPTQFVKNNYTLIDIK